MQVYVHLCKITTDWKEILKEKFFEIFNEKISDEDIIKNEFGKPISGKTYFSISHSKDLLAIAFSKEIEIGIDIQICKLKTDAKKFANKILTPNEMQEINDFSAKTLIKYWARKESAFKLNGNEKTFNPNQIETKMHCYFEKEIEFDNKFYYLSIASKCKCNFIFI